jgi:tetratricopeptide (TPR) repeat protein
VEIATRTTPADNGIRGVACDDFCELLSLDSASPFYLCACGDLALANNELESAEQHYQKSLAELPEYVAAHFGLACVLRRQRRADELAIHLRKSLIGPLAFYGGSFWADNSLPGSFRKDWQRKALLWLQGCQVGDELLKSDSFIARMDELTFQPGVAERSDVDVLQTIVDEYATAGAYSEAALVWQLIGDCASAETTTFRQRYGLNPTRYGTRLAELLELAGNVTRAALVKSMLAAMEKPEGLYL